VVKIGCGDFHSAALTEKGDLYTWGGGGYHFNKGQLGHGHLNDVESPEAIKAFKDKAILTFSCGGYHMMAVTMENEVYSWGSGMYGECGFGEFADSPTPRKVNVNFQTKLIVRHSPFKDELTTSN
jgi:RCC1 and BTB domain-containing protein